MMSDDAETLELKRIAGVCEFCRKDLRGHRFALFASVAAPNANDPVLLRFVHAYGHRRWADLHEYKHFEPLENAAVVYTLECPECPGDKIVDMILVRDPFELYEANTVVDRISAVDEEAALVQSLISESEWKAFG